MTFYRCFFFDAAGHIERPEVIEADDDAAALRASVRLFREQHKSAGSLEIWQGARKVFPAGDALADIDEFKRALTTAGFSLLDDDATDERSNPGVPARRHGRVWIGDPGW